MKNLDHSKKQLSKKFLRVALIFSILLIGHEAKTQTASYTFINPFNVGAGYSTISNGSEAPSPFSGMIFGIGGKDVMIMTPATTILGSELHMGENLKFYSPQNRIEGLGEIVGGSNGLFLRGSSSALIMRIDQSGKVGIGGVAGPNGALHVYGDDNNGSTAAVTIESPSQRMLIDGNEIDANTGLYLQHNNDTHIRMAEGGGNVGVGLVPLEKLHITGNFRLDNGLFFTNKEMIFRSAVGDTGTVNSNNIIFQNSAEIEIMRINKDGNVGIGTSTPSQKLEVDGTVKATSFVSSTSSFPDYVFEEEYNLISLQQLNSFIKENKHLPNMPSEKEVIENGLDVTDVIVKSVENIENIYLHLIQLNEKLEALEKENAELKKALLKN